ncbi:MAG: hypothetical protein E7631_10500 [Ruminococcaceae bacterium]|nr:hypothetical protein [Oscillospiraceae bacterium]
MKDFKKCKCGMFIHHILPEAHYADGTQPQTIDEMADAFDAEGFADSLQRMGIEYIIFTAWHFAVQPLYPSAVSEKWRPGNCPKRDLLGDIIESVKNRGILVLFYTHPRDGHDFSEDDKEKTGWGRGTHETDNQQPNLDNFNYERWNEYMLELYEELADRYADRLTGFYTDSNGPKDPADYLHPHKDHQVINYLRIRNIMKSRNPALIAIQNYYGNVYTNDYGNSETYAEYISSVFKHKDAAKWHCSKTVATTLMPFSTGWMHAKIRNEESVVNTSLEDILQYTLFNGSCSVCGNVLFASGPYVEGNLWSTGVEEYLSALRMELSRYNKSFMDACPSKSYPTLAGSTLEQNQYRFWMTGEDEKYEYLHCVKLPEDGVLEWGCSEDGIRLIKPEAVTGNITITGYMQTESGYRMTYIGTPDRVDTVIRFTREGTSAPCGYEWIANTDKRIAYFGNWCYTSVWVYDEKNTANGCYEREVHYSNREESFLYLAFEGSIVELYGVLDKDMGAADVYIDGIYCATVNQQSVERKAHEMCFRSIDLYGGKHILQIYTKDDRMFTVDAIKIIY